MERVRKEKIVSVPTPSIVRSIADAIILKDSNLFFVSTRDGSVPIQENHGFGLYLNDCRYLSGYTLRLGGTRPHVLVSNASQGFRCVIQLSNEEFAGLGNTTIQKEQLGIRWKRVVESGQKRLSDSILFQNFGLEPMRFEVSLEFSATFEDIFVVRGLLKDRKGRRQPPRWNGDRLAFFYRGADDQSRGTFLHFFPRPTSTDEGRATFEISLGPQQAQEIVVTVTLAETGAEHLSPPSEREPPNFAKIERTGEQERRAWLSHESRVESDSLSLNRTIHRALLDLKMLESRHDGQSYFAAGTPWFATLFGRDSLITAVQTLAFDPSIAEQTLKLLALHQGKEVNAWRDEAPGKILHELRVGELARTGEIPHTPYYGTVDATPLFLVLLARHAHWSGSLSLFHALSENVERAIEWIDRWGEIDRDGYVKYACQSGRGLHNQGWKDSGDGIMNRDGSLAESPIALVEVQGYVYEAKIGLASLFELAGDKTRAERLRKDAADLKERFNRDFWVEENRFFALALQKGNRPAAVISSNPGHALWSGIVDSDKAEAVVQALLAPDMFSGWGIRTLSEKEKRYNPVGYHLGTIWPHDNSLIAAGFKRYGFVGAALRVFSGIFRSSIYFDNQRLPELFSGFSEGDYGVPVHYPVACHPQAWAAGAVPHLIEILLGLEPEGFARRLRIVHPVLPRFVDRLEFRGLRVGEASVDLEFSRTARGSVSVEVLQRQGDLEVLVEPGFPVREEH